MRPRSLATLISIYSLCSAISLTSVAIAQGAPLARPTDRIHELADDRTAVVRLHNHHPLALPQNEIGPESLDARMEQMILVLQSDSAQDTALNSLISAQHNPSSPQYHQWLTPEQFGTQFGVSEHDVAQVESWLRSQGLQVDMLPSGRRTIVFSGTVGQIERAFHTDIHAYQFGGELHYANATDPSVPQAFAGVVHGVVALHNFHSKPMHHLTPQPLSPGSLATFGGSHYLAPADFATIYDVAPLYDRAVDGAGQSIAIVGRSNINVSDIRQFRKQFGLAPRDPVVIVNGADPGVLAGGEQAEAELDVEWAGAVAKNADVKLVVSKSTTASDGVDLSAQYIVEHNVAPVMSTSFGMCEAAMGSSENRFWNALWQQAAAEGITVLVASGDSGAAGCDDSSSDWAISARGVNGICSTPYSVCVGGTEFDDTASPSLYWSATTDGVTQRSALHYIPESSWNDSGTVANGSGLLAGGGGASTVYVKPIWQTGAGVPTDNRRYVPDVALNASDHDGYLMYLNGAAYIAGGTSASSPAFAGVMALTVQQTGSRQGNANTVLYPMADRQMNGGPAAFHDIVYGDNSVPGATGYTAKRGYDAVTGLGSVDADVLAKNWSSKAPDPQLTISPSTTALVLRRGQNATMAVNINALGVNSAVGLSMTGLPPGVSATLSRTAVAAPGSGTAYVTVFASTAASATTTTATIKATSGSLAKLQPLTITVQVPPTLTLTESSTAATMNVGASTTLTLNVVSSGTLDAPITLSASGIPSGMTATFSTTSIAAPGSGSSSLQMTAGQTLAAGTYVVTISAQGGGITRSVTFSVTVKAQPNFTISSTLASVSLGRSLTGSLKLTATVTGGFNSPISLSVAGLPQGVSGTFSPSAMSASGGFASVLTLSANWGATVGNSTITISATGGGINHTLTVPLTISGSLDDTATVQQMISSTGASGGKILIPAGTYVIKSSLVVAHNQVSVLCQRGALFKKAAIFTMFIVTGNNVTIDGCAIDGTGFQARENGIHVLGGSNVQITNNKLTNNANYGIYLNGVSGARVQGNTVSGNWGNGIFAENNTKNVSVLNNVIDNSTGGGVAIGFHSTTPGQGINNIQVQNNALIGGTLFCLEIGGFGGLSPTGIVVTGNSCKAGASGVFGGYSFDTVTQGTISNNTFDSNGLTRASVGAFELVNCVNMTLSGNKTIGIAGLSLDGSSNSNVYGNTFQNCNGSCMYIGTSRPVAMQANRVTQNTLSEGTPHGQSRLIFMQCNNYSANCSNNQITNNIITGTLAGETAVWVERDAGEMSGTLVSGNIFKQTSSCVLFGRGTAPNYASKNTGCSVMYTGDGVSGSVIQP